ncbi:MAG: DUF2330 domain-containing protein [Verrucomicrobia bacterium]|nr:DUF2330 domain-containing protein [Verrucomicrobiota bacterium]
MRQLRREWFRRPRQWFGLAAGIVAMTNFQPGTRADGCFVAPRWVWDKARDINEPSQKAIILYDAGREDLILQVKYEGPAAEFGWLIPVPGQPVVEKASMGAFYELSQLTQRRFGGGTTLQTLTSGISRGPYRPPPPVKVIEEKTVGAYDIAVLSTENADALNQWLQTNEFKFPPDHTDVLDYYVRRHWCFVAVRVHLDKSGRALGPRSRGSATRPTVKPSVARKLRTGELHPLRLSFDSAQCVYPLKISGVNGKPSEVQIYVLAGEPMSTRLMTTEGYSRFELLRNGANADWGKPLPEFMRVSAATLPKARADLPRLQERNWFLTKQVRVFLPETMQDLVFVSLLPELIAELGGANGNPRFLAQLGPAAVPGLTRTLQSTNPVARLQAAAALSYLHQIPPLPPLLELLQNHDAGIRWEAIKLLGQTNDRRLLDPAIKLLNDPDPRVRHGASAILGTLEDPRAVKPLLARLKTADAFLGIIYLSAQWGSLEDLAIAEPAWIIGSLGAINQPAAWQALFSLLGDPQQPVRAMARRALLRAKDPWVTGQFISLLNDTNPVVRLEAATAWAELRDRRAVDPLCALLSAADDRTRVAAAIALGKQGDSRAVSALIGALHDGNPEAQDAAQGALRAITGTNLGADPAAWEKWQAQRGGTAPKR